MLPLDLHVLGLSLAFILSQDQTLRCIYIFLFLLWLRLPVFSFHKRKLTVAIFFLNLVLVVCIFSLSKNTTSFKKSPLWFFGDSVMRLFGEPNTNLSETDCKDKAGFWFCKIFKEKILKILIVKRCCNSLATILAL